MDVARAVAAGQRIGRDPTGGSRAVGRAGQVGRPTGLKKKQEMFRFGAEQKKWKIFVYQKLGGSV